MNDQNPSDSTKVQRGVMDRVKQSATAQLSSQKTRATDSLGSVATAVRESGRPLRDNQHPVMAEFVEGAAERLEQWSTRLRERDVNELVRDAQQFARQRPALFIGAAFAAGIATARFLKSSSGNRHSVTMRQPRGGVTNRDVTMPSSPQAGATGYAGGGM
jgi:hypothetical protein